MTRSIALTGTHGFIGSALLKFAVAKEFRPRVIHRSLGRYSAAPSLGVALTAFGKDRSSAVWSAEALSDVSCVIHCAGLTPKGEGLDAESEAEYDEANVIATRDLAELAVTAGVRRFIFLSSARVSLTNKGGMQRDFPFGSCTNAGDSYGNSKVRAEEALREISAKSGLEIVVVRPPLVYGPGVKGNLARLLKLVRLGLPLPFGAVQNMRSLIGLDNLVDLLIRCVDHPEAAGQTFLVSDGEDLSTPELVRYMAAAVNRSPRLFPVPVSLLRLAGGALGKRAEIDRLVGSLQIDISHTRQVLSWTPPVRVQEGIRRMVQGV